MALISGRRSSTVVNLFFRRFSYNFSCRIQLSLVCSMHKYCASALFFWLLYPIKVIEVVL